jgi:hypothetical protein
MMKNGELLRIIVQSQCRFPPMKSKTKTKSIATMQKEQKKSISG